MNSFENTIHVCRKVVLRSSSYPHWAELVPYLELFPRGMSCQVRIDVSQRHPGRNMTASEARKTHDWLWALIFKMPSEIKIASDLIYNHNHVSAFTVARFHSRSLRLWKTSFCSFPLKTWTPTNPFTKIRPLDYLKYITQQTPGLLLCGNGSSLKLMAWQQMFYMFALTFIFIQSQLQLIQNILWSQYIHLMSHCFQRDTDVSISAPTARLCCGCFPPVVRPRHL